MTEKMGPRNALPARQQQLLIELVKNPDLQAACKRAGVGRTTAYRWLEQAAFAEELSRRRTEAMNEALDSVKALTSKAAEVLAALLDSNNESIRRMVCRDIFRHAVKVRELEDIEQRLDQLEQMMRKPDWRTR
jgi:hypothetical protein